VVRLSTKVRSYHGHGFISELWRFKLGERWLSRTEVAEYLGLHPHTIWKMHKEGRIPAVKIGRKLRFSLKDVVQALEPVGF